MACIFRMERGWGVVKGARSSVLGQLTEEYFDDYDAAKVYAETIEAHYPGRIQATSGRRISPKDWDRYCEQAHHEGVRYTAKLHALGERVLARRLSKWRAARGIETKHQKARREYLARTK